MGSGELLDCQGHLGVWVPDLVTLVQHHIVPPHGGDGVYQGGDSLVGEEEDAATGVDISDQLRLGATVGAGAVQDGNWEHITITISNTVTTISE